MSLQPGKNPCEVCGSKDNLHLFDDGSSYCFTTGGCKYNEHKNKSVEVVNKDLIEGQYSAIANRRLSQRTCELFSYQVGLYNNQPCHIANIRSGGKIVAQQIRLEGKKFIMLGDTKFNQLVYKDLWRDKGGKCVIITEGYIDALSIAEAQDCKYPVVTVPRGAGSAKKAILNDLAWLNDFEEIIFSFDDDEAGKAALDECVDLLPPGKVKIAKLPGKDANEVLCKGMIKDLTNIRWTAAEYRPDNIVCGSEVDIETLFEAEPRGISFPYPILDEMVRGLKKHRVYTVYAGTGNGKTSIMKEIVYHIRKTSPSKKIANIFLEENLKTTVKSYIALDNNLPNYVLEENPGLITNERKRQSYDSLINAVDGEEVMMFYKHFGSLDSKRLFNMLEYFVVGKGAEIVVLDHISILISGLEASAEGERRDIDRTMTALRSFTERTGAIILVATQLKRAKGAYGTGEEINEASARGSGAIEHLSDVIISLNRDKNSENPNEAQLKIIKNRVSGFLGEADLLEYNLKTGRYLPKKKTIKIPDKYKQQDEDELI